MRNIFVFFHYRTITAGVALQFSICDLLLKRFRIPYNIVEKTI
jgi:hypothetical protein